MRTMKRVAGQVSLFPWMDAANDDETHSNTAPRRHARSADDDEAPESALRERIAELERRLDAELDASATLEAALEEISDPHEFVPQREHAGPTVARCRDWHRGGCPHACGQQFMEARKHARARLAEARTARGRALVTKEG